MELNSCPGGVPSLRVDRSVRICPDFNHFRVFEVDQLPFESLKLGLWQGALPLHLEILWSFYPSYLTLHVSFEVVVVNIILLFGSVHELTPRVSQVLDTPLRLIDQESLVRHGQSFDLSSIKILCSNIMCFLGMEHLLLV